MEISDSDRYIRQAFQEARFNNSWEKDTIRMLEAAQWQDTLAKKEFIKKLKPFLQLKGIPRPFSLNYGNPTAILEHTFINLEKSCKSIIPLLLKANALPLEIKSLIINEYLSFFSTHNSEDEYFKKVHLRLISIKKEFDRKFVLNEFDQKYRKNNPKNLFTRIVKDSYLNSEIKRAFLILSKYYRLYDSLDIENALNNSALKISTTEVLGKFFFNSKDPENRQFIQFKRNLLFTHFFVLLHRAKFKGPREPISNIFSEENLRLTNLLFVDLSGDIPPKTVNSTYIKSLIKDFYNSKT